MIEQVLVERLLAWSGLTALIGTRLDPVVSIDTTLPGVNYRRMGEEWRFNMAGATVGGTWTGELECWHPEYLGVVAIEQQIRLALNGWSDASDGVFVASTTGGADVYDDEGLLFGRMLQVQIDYHE